MWLWVSVRQQRRKHEIARHKHDGPRHKHDKGVTQTRRCLSLFSVRGAPRYLRSDNDPEFVSTALLNWITGQRIESVLIDTGKPWQNGTRESFNGKFRDECLAKEWFRNRNEAKVVIEDWRQHYNTVRPHSSVQYETPKQPKSLST